MLLLLLILLIEPLDERLDIDLTLSKEELSTGNSITPNLLRFYKSPAVSLALFLALLSIMFFLIKLTGAFFWG